MRVVGLISGTSVDGIDVAAARLWRGGDQLVLAPLGARSVAFEPGLRDRVQAALPPATSSAEELCRLDADLGRAFAQAAVTGVDQLAGGRADLLVSHGQTMYHDVVDGQVRGTLQLGQPAFVAERTGLPVVSDLRARDVAAGGQGAPLVSVLDELLLSGARTPVAALNLGGIANLTIVRPDASTLAFDCGPANALLDVAVRRATGGRVSYDEDGRRAAAGRVDAALLRALLADPYLQRPPPKSTGRERYHAGYLDRMLTSAPVDSIDDQLATLVEAVAVIVARDAAGHGVTRVYVSGGGMHNATLLGALARRLAAEGVALDTIDDLGLPGDAKEAYAFAVLGWLTWHGLTGTVPSCTGAVGPRVLGSITPGSRPLRLPDPDETWRPRRLHVTSDDAPTTAARSVGSVGGLA